MFRTLALAGAALAATAAVAHAQPAPEYVRMAGASDKFEITEARMAMTRSHNPRIMQFARMMVRDHTKSTNMIKAAVRETMGHNPPPAMLDGEQTRMAADLGHSHGPDFDRNYVEQQVRSHQQALDLHRGYADHGDNPALRRTANMIVPVVQQHLDMAHDLQSHMH